MGEKLFEGVLISTLHVLRHADILLNYLRIQKERLHYFKREHSKCCSDCGADFVG